MQGFLDQLNAWKKQHSPAVTSTTVAHAGVYPEAIMHTTVATNQRHGRSSGMRSSRGSRSSSGSGSGLRVSMRPTNMAVAE